MQDLKIHFLLSLCLITNSPQVIYILDEYLPKNSSIDNWLPYYYPDTSTMIADETLIYKDIIKNNVFPFFSNSFLLNVQLIRMIMLVTQNI